MNLTQLDLHQGCKVLGDINDQKQDTMVVGNQGRIQDFGNGGGQANKG